MCTATISTTDNFEFNTAFSHKLKKIKIPFTEVNVNERNKVIENVKEDRQCSIDAAIVRIMKARKILPQHQLLNECVEQLQSTFKPEFKAIKARIQDLISKEYLELDNENSNFLRYIP